MNELLAVLRTALRTPGDFWRTLRGVPDAVLGTLTARRWEPPRGAPLQRVDNSSPLEAFFDAQTTGAGIWKWRHYFPIYHRHMAKFVGQGAHLLEIGVYSGGSLEMWNEYLEPGATIHGVDLAPECKVYERDNVHIWIGDQSDREFWARFREGTPTLDIVIDDGGHTAEQQRITLQELLPHLRPGGVYICEDVHGSDHGFIPFTAGLVRELHEMYGHPSAELAATPSAFQQAVYSIHFYPFVVVIERTDTPPAEFIAPKHGTEWQPFAV